MSHIAQVVPILLVCGCGSLRPGAFKGLTDASPEDTTATEITSDLHSDGRRAELLSAFFGLDSALPGRMSYLLGQKMGGKDGMPVVFSHELDVSTMQAGDFKVTSESGKVGEVSFVTLAPADDPGELRTVLVVGEYGSADDQPVKVEIVGDLLSLNREVNFRGKSVSVIRLEAGPSMVWAEMVPENEWKIGRKATAGPGGGSGCHSRTRQAIRVTWEGGITKPGGEEVDDEERVLYKVVVLNRDGTNAEVTPFALADMGDGDNNHILSLDVDVTPLTVPFPAGLVTDPREYLNPRTTIAVTHSARPAQVDK